MSRVKFSRALKRSICIEYMQSVKSEGNCAEVQPSECKFVVGMDTKLPESFGNP